MSEPRNPLILAAIAASLATLACGGLGGPAPTDWTAYSACPAGTPGCEPPSEPDNAIRMGMALGSPLVSEALREESKIEEDAHIRLNQRMKALDELGWAIDGSDVSGLHDALSGLDPVLADIVAYAAVRGEDTGEWGIALDSTGERACGRGPAKLTYRQARRLGLANVQPAGPIRADQAEDEDAKKAALAKAVAMDGETPEVTGTLAVSTEIGGRACVFVEGPDDRTDITRVAEALTRALGPDAPGLPPTGDPRAIPARLAKLYAADFPDGFASLAFDRGEPVWDTLANQDVPTDRREYVRTNLAHAFGSAVAVRCLLVAKDPAPTEPQATGCADALSKR